MRPGFIVKLEMPRLLQRRGFRDLLIGQTVSALGDWLGTVALMALVLDITGSPTAVGGVLALRLLPSLIAGPLATTFAVRFDRRRTMMITDLIRAGLVVAIPFVDALWWVYTFAFLVEVGNLIFLPARDASIPDLVENGELPSANGLVLGSSYANIPLGAGAFAAIAALVGEDPYLIVFVADAATYLISFAFIRRIQLDRFGREAADKDVSELRRFAGAFRLPLMRAILPALFAIVAGVGALFALGIVYVEDVLGASTVQFGVLIVIFGLGAVGSVVWLQTRDRTSVAIVRAGVVVMGVLLSAMSLTSELAISFGMAPLFGAAAALALVGAISILQERLSGDDRVIGFAAFHVVFRAGMSVFAISAGFVAEQLSVLTLPVVGNIAPTSLVLFASGIVIIMGGAAIRPERIPQARED